MGKESKDIGNLGEELAANYLIEFGYKILDRNFRSHQGEIDIIAEDGDVLVFIEVKNYSFRSFGSPYSAISKSKKENIIRTARYYLHKYRITNKNCRFDVLTIFWDSLKNQKVDLIKDAFRVS
jgi:putative endonuclease